MSGGEPYTALYASWNAELSARGVSGREYAVFVALTQYKVERLPDGTGKAWRPKEDISTSLGITPEAVKHALRGLKRKGCIKPLGKAHKGNAQLYQIMPGCPVFAKGKETRRTALRVAESGHPSNSKGSGIRPQRVAESGYPIRRKEGVSPSYCRANPKC